MPAIETPANASLISIVEVDLGSGFMDEVLALHRANKRYLGFLPDAGFDDRAAAGTLLAAISDDCVQGYVLYDLPVDLVKIVHLCVSENSRGSGVARRLVAELSKRHSERRGIQLACRRSYPASQLWPKLDFRPIGDRQGRSIEGHRLTVWLRDHGQPTLFDSIDDERDLVAVDQMVFEDLIVDGGRAEESRRLFDDWVEDLVELCITDLIAIESNDCEEDDLRDVLIAAANEWRNLSRSNAVPEDLPGRIGDFAPSAGERDHRHVAAAIAGGARYFVTRDGPLLAGAAPVRDEFGIELLRPEELIDRLDRDRRVGIYAPAALQGTDISTARLAADDQGEFTTVLLNNGAGERAFRFRTRLRPALAAPADYEVQTVRDGTRLLGGLSRTQDKESLKVELLRVGATDRLSRAVARQLAFLQRRAAAEKRLRQVTVNDPHPPVPIREALRAENFVLTEDGCWRCRVETGLRTIEELGLSSTDPITAASFERSLWPVKILGIGIPTFVVPIHPAWAEQLFDEGLSAHSLFSREPGLGLSREHVYYRATRPSGVKAPARLLWYVTGADRAHSVGHIRAVSHLADVFVDRPERLHHRFSQLGVWNLEQIRQAADATGRAMALRFVDTEVFANPLDLYALRALYSDLGASFYAPQSPMPVDEEIFSQLYRRSSAYVD
jgi:GNAT superfamily N-acetyltransferase